MFISRRKYIIIAGSTTILGLLAFLQMFGSFTNLFFCKSHESMFDYPIKMNNMDHVVDELDRYFYSDNSNVEASPHNYDEFYEKLSLVLATRSIKPLNELKDIYIKREPLLSCANLWSVNKEDKTFTIVITSTISNTFMRDVIRQTYYMNSSYKNYSFKTVFSLGSCVEWKVLQSNKTLEDCERLIKEEADKYGDIVQSNVPDTYWNLHQRTLTNLRWIYERCPADITLFLDDDYFMLIDNLIEFIEANFDTEKAATSNFYAGYESYMIPNRDYINRWYVPLSEYEFCKYPSYSIGGIKIMSQQTVRKMYLGSFLTEPLLFEDVYIGIIARRLKIKLISSPKLNCYHYFLNDEKGLFESKHCIAWHEVSAKKILSIWQKKPMKNI